MKKHIPILFVLSLGLCLSGSAAAQTGEQAASRYSAASLLNHRPQLKNANIDYDIPTPEEIERCTVSASPEGYVVKDADGRILRMFLPRGDKIQASYYKNGIEVFRQLTGPRDSKQPNEFRWMNNAGTRWGIDETLNSSIDRWKMISAEEVSMEAVAALVAKDPQQFLRLAPSADEIASLGLGTGFASEVHKKVGQMQEDFASVVQEFRLSPNAEWVQFSGGQPGIVPADRDRNPSDVIAYEYVSAILRDGETHKQIILGTIVKVGENNWRLIGVPHLDDPNASQFVADRYTFFVPGAFAATAQIQPPLPEQDEFNKLIDAINEKQDSLYTVAAEARAAIHNEILALMLQCAELQTTLEDADQWIRNAADMADNGVRANEYPDGSRKLEILFEKVKNQFESPEPAAYVKYKQIMADYYQRLHNGEDHLEVQLRWRQNLEKFAEEYGKTDGAARAMLELAGYNEMMQNENEALRWYQNLAQEQPQSDHGKRAAGAIRRIGSVGKVVPFSSQTTAGAAFSLAQLKGSPVVLCFWDSYTGLESDSLRQIASQYRDLQIVSVNVDDRPEGMEQYVKQNPIPFVQLFDTVNHVSQAGQYWGLQIPPMMILIDAEGKVVRQNITSTQTLARLLEELK